MVDCAVFGVPDEDRRSGHRRGRVADERWSSSATTDDLRELVAANLASYKRITEVVIVEQIPRLPSGKVLRRELRAGHTA